MMVAELSNGQKENTPMAKIYFYYSAMNAGKTTALLQSDFNYRERGLKTLCFLPDVVREFQSKITSRIGLSKTPVFLSDDMDVAGYVRQFLVADSLACVLVDEAQFLKKNHVQQLAYIVDELEIPVLTYGLRTDFKGDLFEGSHYLLAWADHIQEIKTICFCGAKATMTVRLTGQGSAVKEGEQVECGGNDRYVALCRKHHNHFSSGRLDHLPLRHYVT